jgi:phospholipase/carboxylesterase
LLHGRGADEHDLIGLSRTLPAQFAYVSPRAPVPVEGGGFTWFENRGPARPLARSVLASVREVRAWLDGPETASYARARTYLFGFSAGMMMAGALLLDAPERFAGAVLLSGALALDAGSPAEPQRLRGLPLFCGRGTLDEVIRTDAYLSQRSGAALTFRSYDHGHSISPPEVRDIRAWFEAFA